MDPKWWAASAWRYIFLTIALAEAFRVDEKFLRQWAVKLKYVLPCGECRRHFAAFRKRLPINEFWSDCATRWSADCDLDYFRSNTVTHSPTWYWFVHLRQSICQRKRLADAADTTRFTTLKFCDQLYSVSPNPQEFAESVGEALSFFVLAIREYDPTAFRGKRLREFLETGFGLGDKLPFWSIVHRAFRLAPVEAWKSSAALGQFFTRWLQLQQT